MGRSVIQNLKPQEVKKIFGNLSQTNYYQVDFSSLSTFQPNQELLTYLGERGVDNDFISREAGLLCSEASLPGTSLATAEVKDNFMGISQEYAHTRLYTDFDLTFYVDNDYKSIKFFEGWIDFIGSGSETLAPIGDGANPFDSNYYRRMRYPDTYKCQSMTITKFEKNVESSNKIKYAFINVFPKTVSAIPVSYGGADILKVSVSFNYDRYVIISALTSINNNKGAPESGAPDSGDAMDGGGILPLGENSQSELDQLRRQAYLDTTRGKVFGRSQIARDFDASYGVTRNSLGEEI